MSLDVIRPQPQGLAVFGNRLGLPPGRVGKQRGQSEMSLRQVRIQPQRGPIFDQGLGDAARRARQRAGEVHVGHRIIGLQPDRLALLADRILHSPQALE